MMPEPTPNHIVIVGGGAGGWVTAEVLRREGFAGAITVISSEVGDAYDRPPLSKHVLTGEWALSKALLIGAKRALELRVEWLRATEAATVDLNSRTITTSGGGTVGFDRLVIATGVRPRHLAGLDRTRGFHTLRTGEDALALREALLGARELLVVGAGFLGLEAAATARKLGLEVVVVEKAERPLAAQLGVGLSQRIVELHECRGVEVIRGVGVDRWEISEGDGVNGLRVSATLEDGRVRQADAVLVAIGSVPNTEWLIDSGVPVANGVLCDSTGRAAPGVWAAGDVAAWAAPEAPDLHRRFEHRMNANEQARVVARDILGLPTPTMSAPYFWTDQYDVKLQVWGHVPREPVLTVLETDAAGERFVFALSENGAAGHQAIAAWNAAAMAFKYRRELESVSR